MGAAARVWAGRGCSFSEAAQPEARPEPEVTRTLRKEGRLQRRPTVAIDPPPKWLYPGYQLHCLLLGAAFLLFSQAWRSRMEQEQLYPAADPLKPQFGVVAR